MTYNDKIKELCQNFRFNSEDFFGDIKIKTTNDIWIIINKSSTNSYQYELQHLNKSRGGGFHHQNGFKDLFHLFRYIQAHETKYFKNYNNVFRVKYLLNSLHI